MDEQRTRREFWLQHASFIKDNPVIAFEDEDDTAFRCSYKSCREKRELYDLGDQGAWCKEHFLEEPSCSVEGCEFPVAIEGICRGHYPLEDFIDLKQGVVESNIVPFERMAL